MCLEMVDAHRRDRHRVGQGFSEGGADQKGSGESRALCVGNRVDVGKGPFRYGKNFTDQR